MDEYVVITEGLQKRFGTLWALRGLDLRVKRGEICGIIGPDGAGKTTILRLLTGLFPPTAGKARVLGCQLTPESSASLDQARHRIGYMPQGSGCFGDLTVYENLIFFGKVYGKENPELGQEIDFLLEFTGLKPFATRLADHLSGGMRQKLGLACSVLAKPELLFLDEPTTGVDPAARQDFWELLKTLQQKHQMSVVVTTPYMDEAARCDQVVLLHDGKILASGPPESLTSLLKGLVLEVKVKEKYRACETLSGLPGVKDVNLFGDCLHLLVEKRSCEDQVKNALAREGLEFGEVKAVSPTLEDVFLSLLAEERK
jgi:ABC-2 type transport system ATP-binding protein